MGLIGPDPKARHGVARGRVGTAGALALGALLGAAFLSIGAGAGADSAAYGASKTTPAESFAYHVLGEAIVPLGARETTVTRLELLDGSFDVTGIPSSLDVHRFYLVDESSDAVEGYLEAHLPLGAKQVEERRGDSPAGDSLNVSYVLPVSGPHQYLAELVYTCAAAGPGAAELRVDAEVVWEPDRPVAERAPVTGVVEVTAYSKSSAMDGSTGPVTFAVKGARARSLLGALNALPLGPRVFCMENALFFKMIVRPARGAPASLEADEWDCDADVVVTEDGRAMPDLHDASCSLLRAVVKVLPAHEADTTRVAGTGCDPHASALSAHGSKIPISALVRLTKIAEYMAAANGDVHPTSVAAVATTHAAALTLATPGDLTPSVPANGPVYLIVMRGSFTASDASPPPGAPLPRGTYLCVVVGRSTFQVTDWGLGDKPPPRPLSSLGPVSTLRSATAAKKGDDLTKRIALSRTSVKGSTPIKGELVVTNNGPAMPGPTAVHRSWPPWSRAARSRLWGSSRLSAS